MTVRRGFTLIETMIALVVSSIIVTLAYATLGAGTDAEARVAAARTADADLIGARTLLTDAVRHLLAADARDPRAMQVVRDAGGDVVSFAFSTRGVVPPFGGSAPWRVTVARDSVGVRIVASAEGEHGVPLVSHVARAQRIRVQFLPRVDGEWTDDVDDPSRAPAAVRIALLDARGAAVTPEILARTAAVGAP
jgi:prepilin-type N-terminal cleavage/methylation domain-containing protein